ncbi:hypothetical protein LKMONMHP_3033 [Methylobacterium organophilum]|uniref:Uncharacterized protein n=2 Tax=Methylobacterium organophilum TaxID=410 RepID=A0ABQ4TAU9_METOR|nr:hypothetical protein LKMONMHP_3033 [Methylobacterium organophilum]
MINIVHAHFRRSGHPGNMSPLANPRRGACCLTLTLALLAQPALASPAEIEGELAAGVFTLVCDLDPGCTRVPPGPPDRDIHPFEGRLGRPCGWRERATPSGTRHVRICH